MSAEARMSMHVTATSEGLIPHIRAQWRGYIIEAPVRIRLRRLLNRHYVVDAERTSGGYLLYALPGGDVALASEITELNTEG